eukprot:6060343-Pleurochrysis_carterae.AAC.2
MPCARVCTQLLLQRGARADARDSRGRTPLHAATMLRRGAGDAKVIAMLEYALQRRAPARG